MSMEQEVKIEPTSLEPLEEIRYYIRYSESDKALASADSYLAKKPNEAQVHYFKGQAYGQKGELDQAIACYENALSLEPRHHASYIILKGIYQIRELEVEESIYNHKKEKENYLISGSGSLENISQLLEDDYRKQIGVYLDQAKAYLIYDAPDSNVTEYPQIEANLRDAQDILKDMNQSYKKNDEMPADGLLKEIIEVRSSTSKKHVRSLVALSESYSEERKFQQSIDLLKEADSQVAKFFAKEKSFVKVWSLIKDDEIVAIYEDIHEKLTEYTYKQLDILSQNKEKLVQLGKLQETKDQEKLIEQSSDSLIQLDIVYFSRVYNIDKNKAELHPNLIPIYESLLTKIPSPSPKFYDYNYRLARCYLAQKNMEKANEHIEIARKGLGAYRVEDFMTKMKNLENKGN